MLKYAKQTVRSDSSTGRHETAEISKPADAFGMIFTGMLLYTINLLIVKRLIHITPPRPKKISFLFCDLELRRLLSSAQKHLHDHHAPPETAEISKPADAFGMIFTGILLYTVNLLIVDKFDTATPPRPKK